MTVPPLSGAEMTGRRRASRDDRRREIVQAALEFFAVNGLAADTRGLAERLNVSQGLIYRYFPTKADLLEAVFEQITLADHHAQWEATLCDPRPPLEVRLTQFYASFLKLVDRPEWLRVIMFASLSGSDVTTRYYENHFKTLIDLIALQIRKAKPEHFDGPVTDDERERVFALHSVFYYYLIRRHMSHISPRKRGTDWIERTVRTFLDGALAEETLQAEPASPTAAG